jgi:hypothetical protein
LSEPILLGGVAPRSVAILNGTLAGAVGLGLQLWLAGILIWAVGHLAAGLGREARSPLRRGRAPASARAWPPVGVRRRDDEHSRISPHRVAPRRLPAWVALVGQGFVV